MKMQPESQPSTKGRTNEERELASKMRSALNAGADVRARKVRRLRAAIRVNEYENDLKLVIALERLASLDVLR